MAAGSGQLPSRDWTADFNAVRAVHHPNLSAAQLIDIESGDALLEGGVGTASRTINTAALPPWVDFTSQFRERTSRIQENLQLLQNLYTARLENFFDSESERNQDYEISQCSADIKTNIHDCGRLIKLIPTAPGTVNHRHQQDIKVMQNAMKAMGMILNKHSKTFRDIETKAAKKLRERQQAEGPIVNSQGKRVDTAINDSMIEGIANNSLTEQQQAQLEELEYSQDRRDKAIVELATNINELSQLFKELNVLVIEQGSILDRIDYNVEQAVERVERGTGELVEAEKISKKGVSTKAIGILIIVCALLILVFIIKKSSQ